MAKLISLQGANVTLPSGLSINSNSTMIYSISGEISYMSTSGIPTHLTDSFTQIAFGYNLGTDVPSANLISYVTGTGVKTRISTDYNFSLLDLSGSDITNENLIQWFIDNNATIEGGIYEEEHTVQIINPQMYILPPTKVVGSDLVVSAEEVVVNETAVAGFVQVHPYIGDDEYTYLDNMDTSKVYTIYEDRTGAPYHTLTYSDNEWKEQDYNEDGSSPDYGSIFSVSTVSSNKIKMCNSNGGYVYAYDLIKVLEGPTIAPFEMFEDIRGEEVLAYVTCFIQNTPITLADSSYKPIQDITYEDNLLVWDFDNGCFTSSKPIWIQQERKTTEYNHLVFSDGSELNTVNQHRIFNIEKGMFTYPMTDDTPIGTTTFNDKGEFITLVSKEVIKEEVNYYNIITDYHINLFAGNILTSCRLSNIYLIEDMKYVKDNRDIIDYEEFNNIPIEYYYGLRLGEQPTDINRDGAVSFGDTSVEDYVKRLIANRKDVNS